MFKNGSLCEKYAEAEEQSATIESTQNMPLAADNKFILFEEGEKQMTKEPKVRAPHPYSTGSVWCLSMILLVAVLVGTYVLSMATIIDS